MIYMLKSQILGIPAQNEQVELAKARPTAGCMSTVYCDCAYVCSTVKTIKRNSQVINLML